MHEYSIVQALLDQVEHEADSRHATSVQRVEIRVGELAGIEIDLLRSAWKTFRQRTLCHDAHLVIDEVASRWVCPRCERAFLPGDSLLCVSCGRPARLDQGDEILLQRIEMEVAGADST